MATRIIKWSQFDPVPTITDTTGVPVLHLGQNQMTTAGAIADLVTKDRIGLDKVENLAPMEMPVSVPVAAAIEAVSPTVVRGTTDW